MPKERWLDLDKRQKSGGPFCEREKKFQSEILDKLREINQMRSKKKVQIAIIDKEDVDNPGVTWVQI